MFHLFPFLNVLDNVLVAAAKPGDGEMAAYASSWWSSLVYSRGATTAPHS